MLDAKIKQLKKEGLQNTSHKPAIELEDHEKLKNSEIPFTYPALVPFEKMVGSTFHYFGVALALKVSEAWKEEVLHVTLRLKATILCRWRMTKARKTTQAEFQT